LILSKRLSSASCISWVIEGLFIVYQNIHFLLSLRGFWVVYFNAWANTGLRPCCELWINNSELVSHLLKIRRIFYLSLPENFVTFSSRITSHCIKNIAHCVFHELHRGKIELNLSVLFNPDPDSTVPSLAIFYWQLD